MKITDIISGEKPSLSFEVFPPKSGANFETVEEAALKIAALKPSYMSSISSSVIFRLKAEAGISKSR